MKKYEFLFPYEKIPKDSRILIYGAGKLGQEYYTQMQITDYCKVVGFVDQNYIYYRSADIKVYSPQDVKELVFDYAVIAVRLPIAYEEIRNNLIMAGVTEDKIVAVFTRQYEEKTIEHKLDDLDESGIYSYGKGKQAIAILVAGGYGDNVIQKRLIQEIIRYLPMCIIDIFSIRHIEFIKQLYSDENNVKNVIPDLGSRYLSHKDKYSLSLTIEACHYINVDFCDFDRLEDKIFIEKIRKLIDVTKLENETISTPVYLSQQRRVYKGYNAYSGFNYDGVFEICDKKVSIPLDECVGMEFNKILNKWPNRKYITINCGNGECSDQTMVAKSWPLRNYDCLVSLIKSDFKSISIIQLGDKNAKKVNGVDKYILGEDFSFVEHVLSNSLLHIDIEGGLVHIASQLGVKCIVLFGPTSIEYYGYDNNVNIRAGKCHNCWGLYSNINKCAKGMKEPECMYSITPELVYSKVRSELLMR